MKKKTKKSLKVGGLSAFRIEDESVLEALQSSDNASHLVNEAIREYGPEAMIRVLEREIKVAQAKYDALVAAAAKKKGASSQSH